MTFDLPTNKTEMYSTLKTIYAFYRLNLSAYAEIDRSPLALERLNFVPLTNDELTEKALALVEGKVMREKREYAEKIEKDILSKQEKITELNEKYQDVLRELDEKFKALKDSLREEGNKKGLSYSSFLTDKMYEIETDNEEKRLKITLERDEKLALINGEISALNTKLFDAESFYQNILEKETTAKFIELKDEQSKLVREVFKYNNSLDEREKRYNNANTTTDITLQIRYMELKSKNISKEYLVDLGYYTDVMNCIAGYYDTLSPSAAYFDIKDESGLIQYLEDYYQDFVYMYRTKYTSSL